MRCNKCGYELEAFDSSCPRCARWATTACSVCGTVPVSVLCERCRAEICDKCTVSTPEAVLCSACAAREGIVSQDTSQRTSSAPTVSQSAGFTPALPLRPRPTPPRSATIPPPSAPAYLGGVPFSGLSPSAGFFDSLSRAFIFVRESMAMAFSDKDLLIPSFLSLLASAALLAIVVVVSQVTGLLKWVMQRNHSDWMDLLVFVPLAFLIYVVVYFFTGMTINLVDTHLKGRDARLGEAFADSANNFGALLTLALATTGVNLATALLRGGRRGRGLEGYAADAIDRVWLVASFLILPAIIIEDRPFRAAVERAREIHSGNLLPIAVGEVALIILNRVFGFVTLLVAAGLGYLLWSATHSIVLPLIVAGLLLAFISAFNAFVRTAYYTCLFLWAVEIERVGAMAPIPAPLAPAVMRA